MHNHNNEYICFPFLAESDIFEITQYLHPLDKAQIFDIALCLGLGYTKMRDTMDSQTYRADVIAAWLRREDNVKLVPTWRVLVMALNDIGQNGIASKISKDKNIMDSNAPQSDTVQNVVTNGSTRRQCTCS